MGWNVLALFVSGLTANETVAEVGPGEPTGSTVEADEATAGRSDDLVYAAESGGWAQVWTRRPWRWSNGSSPANSPR